MRPFLSQTRRIGRRSRTSTCRPRLEWMEPRTLLSAVTWTGDAGDDNWDTPANWSCGQRAGRGRRRHHRHHRGRRPFRGVSDSIDSLTSSVPLSITGGTLSIASASTTGSLTIDGGTLADAGGLTVGGLLTLTAGTLSGSGDVDADGGILSTAGGDVTLDGQTLTNAARQTATWNGILEMEDGATFNNLGSFLAIAQGSFDDSAGFDQDGSDPSAFDDAGSFTASLATGASSTVQFDFMNVPFVAEGATVDVQSGYLDLLGGGTSTAGTFTVASGATLGFGGGTQTIDAASSIVGAGTVNFNGYNTFGTTTIDGTYDVTGATILSDSKANFDGTVESLGASLSVSDGTMSFNVPLSATAAAVPSVTVFGDGTLDLGADAFNPTTLTLSDGIVNGTGTIKVSGQFDLRQRHHLRIGRGQRRRRRHPRRLQRGSLLPQGTDPQHPRRTDRHAFGAGRIHL